MNREFDLDSLKSAWQETSNEKNYSSGEIFSMLKRKSISAVKWVFIISLIEIVFAVGLYIYFFATVNISEYHQTLLRDYGNLAYVYEALNFIVYGVTFWFIWLFFKSYQKIKVQSSVRDLSQDIINFRKTVQYFIRFNLVMFFIILVMSFVNVWKNNPNLNDTALDSEMGIIIIALSAVIILSVFGLIWLYYYLVYGTFQRRLKRNLRDLDTMN